MHITLVAGARPNFMKVSPIINEIKKRQSQGIDVQYSLVHTGQHYDKLMSGLFFEELNIPQPDVNLAVGSGTQAEQTGAIMIAFEKYLTTHPTDLVIVVGDVTSTMACSIVTKKLGIKLAHVEAGIRSFDLSMPEEINRMVTDSITDYFFITSDYAQNNLQKAGIPNERIFFVGNVMIDCLLANLHKLQRPSIFKEYKLQAKKYIILTLHRPGNVDNTENLLRILQAIDNNAQGHTIVFPIHPRTEQRLANVQYSFKNIQFTKPLGYLEFIYCIQNSLAVITDSGGITEETTVLGVPCMTMRDNTERPETCTIGTNELIGTNPDNLVPSLQTLFNGKWKQGSIPPLWDGKAAERIMDVIVPM